MVGLAGELESPASVRPDRAGDTHGHVHVDESVRVSGARRCGAEGVGAGPALLDVQLDETADPSHPVRLGANPSGVVPGRRHSLRHRHAGAVAQG